MGFSAWIPAALQGAGNAIGSYFGYRGQEDTNKMNWQIAQASNAQNLRMFQENMAWQERMSNTAFRRARQDMIAAGINPILMATQGGANTPSVSTPSAVTGAPMQNSLASLGSGLSSAVSSAVDVFKQMQEVKNLASTNEQIQSQTALNSALRNTQVNSAAKILADTAKVKAQLPKEEVHSKAWKALDHVAAYSSKSLNDSMKQADQVLRSNKPLYKQVDDFVLRQLNRNRAKRVIEKHRR